MTMTDAGPRTEPPVTFQGTVLVGVEDTMFDGMPPVPAPPTTLTVADVLAPAADTSSALPDDGILPRARMATAVGSIVVLLVAVAALGWFRFGDAAHIAGSEGPIPSVAISSPTSGTLIAGAPVRVELGAGAAVERVDLFVDGDWTGTDTSAPFEPEWEHRSDGTHELKAKVIDSDGRVRYSDPVRVTIGS